MLELSANQIKIHIKPKWTQVHFKPKLTDIVHLGGLSSLSSWDFCPEALNLAQEKLQII